MSVLLRIILSVALLLHPAAALAHCQTVCRAAELSCCCDEMAAACPCCPSQAPASPAPESKLPQIDTVLPESIMVDRPPIIEGSKSDRVTRRLPCDSARSVQSRLCIWLT
jgi:hypothetical protein